jgi:hypothetical protein
MGELGKLPTTIDEGGLEDGSFRAFLSQFPIKLDESTSLNSRNQLVKPPLNSSSFTRTSPRAIQWKFDGNPVVLS